jgi:hypothetical protein
MTSGFEQQSPLANHGFSRAAARPHQVGVKLPTPPTAAASRLAELRTFAAPPAAPADRAARQTQRRA